MAKVIRRVRWSLELIRKCRKFELPYFSAGRALVEVCHLKEKVCYNDYSNFSNRKLPIVKFLWMHELS